MRTAASPVKANPSWKPAQRSTTVRPIAVTGRNSAAAGTLKAEPFPVPSVPSTSATVGGGAPPVQTTARPVAAARRDRSCSSHAPERSIVAARAASISRPSRPANSSASSCGAIRGRVLAVQSSSTDSCSTEPLRALRRCIRVGSPCGVCVRAASCARHRRAARWRCACSRRTRRCRYGWPRT